jgi:Druantia protein DruA
MEIPTILQDRPFGPEQLAQVQALIGQNGGWSRYRLSRELARLWDWRTGHGQLKDMAARALLLKLQEHGWIQLPARRMKSPTRSGRPPAYGEPLLEERPVACALKELLPLRLLEVSRASQGRRRLERALHRYHYLGYRSRVGQNLQYWVCDQQDRPLACVVFGAPAWQCAVRDQWIGWKPIERIRQLGRIANNTRLLIFSWLRVPHLASHILSQISRRIGQDWQAKYGRPIWLLETFVDRQRFAGTCYRAANWIFLGQTQGRGRQGPSGRLSTTIKDVYVWPLHPDARPHLNTVEDKTHCSASPSYD